MSNPSIQKWDHLKPNQHCRLEIDEDGTHRWRNPQGQHHRVDAEGIQDGPAFFTAGGTQAWLINGKHHRIDGPAAIYWNGDERWYLDNVRVTQEEWAADPRVIEFHPRTQEGSESWLIRL